MQKDVQLFLGMFLTVVCISAKADSPVFGNSPGNGNAFNLSFESGNTFGGAVLFTPSENIDVSSVTLWLNNYNGQNGISPSVAIYGSYEFGNGTYEMAAEIASLNTPAANNGSAAAFNFSAPAETILESGQAYWLFAYGLWGGGSGFGAACYWEAGGSLCGDGTYDQSDFFNNGGLAGQTSAVPAFSLNIVPEPGYAALLSIPTLFGIGRLLKNRSRIRRK